MPAPTTPCPATPEVEGLMRAFDASLDQAFAAGVQDVDGVTSIEAPMAYYSDDSKMSQTGNPTEADATRSTIRSVFRQVLYALANMGVSWEVPALTNGWAIFDTSGVYQEPGFRKNLLGQVRLKGLVKGGAVNYSATSSCFTLPEGYRPGAQAIFAVMSNGGGADSLGQVRVAPDGTVRITPPSGNHWVSLDGISFDAEQ